MIRLDKVLNLSYYCDVKTAINIEIRFPLRDGLKSSHKLQGDELLMAKPKQSLRAKALAYAKRIEADERNSKRVQKRLDARSRAMARKRAIKGYLHT